MACPRHGVTGGGKFQRLPFQLMPSHFPRARRFHNLTCTGGLDGAPSMHSDDGRPAIHTLREVLRSLLFVRTPEQCAEIQRELVVRRVGRRERSSAAVAIGRELNAIGGEAICNEGGTHAIGRRVVVEHGQQESAHVFLLCGCLRALPPIAGFYAARARC
jgi:hypothetical protein